MKIIFAICAIILLNLSFGFATVSGNGGSTDEFCSPSSPKTCAHLHYLEYPTTTKEAEFLVHVESSDETKIITDINVKLWMDMGDGTGHEAAPVEIYPSDEENHFNVQNAWFPMVGDWQVIISFVDNGELQKIIIPMSIKQ